MLEATFFLSVWEKEKQVLAGNFFFPLSLSLCLFFHPFLHNISHARGAVFIHLIASTSAYGFSLGGLMHLSLSISSSVLSCTLAFTFTPTQSSFPSHLRCIPPHCPPPSPPHSIPPPNTARLAGCVRPGRPHARHRRACATV